MSDLHVGQREQSWLWPRFEDLLLADLEITVRKAGGCDLIFFSGDLAQKGASEEFGRFDRVLERIRCKLSEIGYNPKIVTVPGNHDLLRPSNADPITIALSHFRANSNVQDGIWDDKKKVYSKFFAGVFANYSDWRQRNIDNGIHLAPVKDGIIPGDASYTLSIGDFSIGVVGLNTTWLQLGGGDYRSQLHVDAKQLLAVTEDNPGEWVSRNALNFLVTHHPPDWLHAESRSFHDSDIDPAGRFDLHMFGHMHEARSEQTVFGGGVTKRRAQAASLFGLERYGDGSEKRIQGYSMNALTVSQNERVLECWPRQLIEIAGGGRKLVPDSSQNIDENTNSFKIRYASDSRATAQSDGSVFEARSSATAVLAPTAFDPSDIRLDPVDYKAHMKVRRVELQNCISMLRESRKVWLVSEWGMGGDSFLAAVGSQIDVPLERMYKLDLSDYVDRTTFFDLASARYGATFQQICEAISDLGPAILILDDVDVGTAECPRHNLEADLEALAAAVSDFVDETFIIIRARRAPANPKLGVIGLAALDEADTAIFSREHSLGSDRYSRPDAASKIYRHTDGIPARIDAVLRDLQIISLDDLIGSNPDFAESGNNIVAAPAAIVATVDGLQRSQDLTEARAFTLLQALAALPQGEQLSRIRRFLGPHAFHASHARALIDRGLVNAITLSGPRKTDDEAMSKSLVVPRPVRDYVRDHLDESAAKSIDRQALELYFGREWGSGSIERSPTGKRARSALCDGYEIQNAIALILRAARRALAGEAAHEISAAIHLSSAFVECLIQGDHFRSAASLCTDVIRMLNEQGGFEREANVLTYELARSLRMMGEVDEARVEFERLNLSSLSKSQRQHAELNLALCYEKLNLTNLAAQTANRVIALGKSSNSGLQAKVVLAEQISDGDARRNELRKLLAQAVRQKTPVIANNLKISLAEESEIDADEKCTLLREVVQSASAQSDFYNGARAIVALAMRSSRGRSLSPSERTSLFEAYHYLYNERLYNLFDQCHASLWKIFETEGDDANLLNLFRHSSFIWRLTGREEQESKYLSKLMRRLDSLLRQDLREVTRDGAYFVVRVSVVMGELSSE